MKRDKKGRGEKGRASKLIRHKKENGGEKKREKFPNGVRTIQIL